MKITRDLQTPPPQPTIDFADIDFSDDWSKVGITLESLEDVPVAVSEAFVKNGEFSDWDFGDTDVGTMTANGETVWVIANFVPNAFVVAVYDTAGKLLYSNQGQVD